jgi:hypothetical protein
VFKLSLSEKCRSINCNMYSKSMECSVCYEGLNNPCEFVCGHSFCYQCVKTWYQKGSQTCPMCRTTMCFRGVSGLKREWEREKREGILESVVENLLGDMEGGDDYEYGMDMLALVYDRYNKMVDEYPWIDVETLEYVLLTPWIDIDGPRIREYHDVPTYMRYLMVSKTSWGVKRCRFYKKY